MDLWIRSQDDHLISLKDNDIYIETRYVNKPRIETEIGHEYFKEKVYVIENNFHYLGTYKSKERALEVLDEIQKFLQPDFKCDGYETEAGNGYYNMIKLHFSEPNIFHKRIYEMPKE